MPSVSTISVLVLFTPEAAQALGSDALVTIQQVIDLQNTILANSGVSRKVFLSGAEQLTEFEEGKELGGDLRSAKALTVLEASLTDDRFGIKRRREKYAADIVSVWVELAGPTTIGSASRLLSKTLFEQGSAVAAERAFLNVIVRAKAGAPLFHFAHELGHNMGLGHDLKSIDPTGDLIFDFAHGYVDTTVPFRTVMADDQACLDAGFEGCPRIPFYSSATPGIELNGKPVGNPISADNARVLRETIPFVASYRQSPIRGEALFATTDGSGNISTLEQHTDWDTDWNLIIPGDFGRQGPTDLLLYRRSVGEGLFVNTDNGDIAMLRQHTDWDKDWDLIVPGNFGGSGHTGLLLYKRSTGEGLFVSTDGNGNVATLHQHTDWDKDWDLIVPGNFGGSGFTGLLLYKRSTGEALFVSTDGSGNIATLHQHTDWDKDWDLIVPGNFGGSSFTGLLLYKRSTGDALFVSTDGSGNIATLRQHTDWDRDWDLIVPGNFGGSSFTGLLLYKRSTGEGLFVSTDGNGNVTTLHQHTDWDKDWDLIVPGDFGGNGFTDVLFYRR